MKFKMNNRTWEIKDVDKDWLLEEYKKEYEGGMYCFGLTRYSQQIIYLNEELCEDSKKQTLLHELMHCYIWSYCHQFNNITEEEMCDISANSHDIIHEIVEKYCAKPKTCKYDPKTGTFTTEDGKIIGKPVENDIDNNLHM